MRKYTLDACALIAYLNDEDGADVVEKLISEASAMEIDLSMFKVNLLEVYYGILRDVGKSTAEEVLSGVQALPIQIVGDISDELFREAGRIKATYKLSLADALALGLASISGSLLVTADHHELDIVETHENIGLFWIR